MQDCFGMKKRSKRDLNLDKRRRAEEADQVKKDLREYHALKKHGIQVPPDKVDEAKQLGVPLKGTFYEQPITRILYNSELYKVPPEVAEIRFRRLTSRELESPVLMRRAYEAQDASLKNLLSALDLYSKEYLYTVFTGNGVVDFFKRGTYRGGNLIDALTFWQSQFKKGDGRSPLLEFIHGVIDKEQKPYLAIYRGGHFQWTGDAYKFRESLKKRNALAGLVKITHEQETETFKNLKG